MAVAEGALEYSDIDVVFLDFTGNEGRSARLAALADSSSRVFRSSSVEPFDIWHGDWLAVLKRLLAFFGQAELWFPEFDFGDAYVALQKAIVLEVCRPPAGPPHSSAELLARLEDEGLQTCDALSGLPRDLVDLAIGRMCSSVQVDLGDSNTNLDGEWAWGDAEVAYVGLLEEETMFRSTLGPMLIGSLAEHLEELHGRGRSCVVFFDAVPEDLRTIDVAPLFGAAAAFRSAVVLLPETAGQLDRFARSHFPGLRADEEEVDLEVPSA